MVISPLMLLVVLIAYVVIQAQKHPTYPTWNTLYVSLSESICIELIQILSGLPCT